MGFKSFICVICNSEVTKPQSYSYKDGRACRVHSEVQQAHEIDTKRQQETAAAKKSSYLNSLKRPSDLSPFSGFKDPNSYCWHCSAEGLPEQEILYRLLVNLSKAQLNGLKVNVLDPESPHIKMTKEEIGDAVVLKQFPVKDLAKWKLTQLIRNRDMQMVASMTELVVLCLKCSQDFDFDWTYNKVPIEKMSLNDVLVLGDIAKQVADDVAMRKILEKVFHKTDLNQSG